MGLCHHVEKGNGKPNFWTLYTNPHSLKCSQFFFCPSWWPMSKITVTYEVCPESEDKDTTFWGMGLCHHVQYGNGKPGLGTIYTNQHSMKCCQIFFCPSWWPMSKVTVTYKACPKSKDTKVLNVYNLFNLESNTVTELLYITSFFNIVTGIVQTFIKSWNQLLYPQVTEVCHLPFEPRHYFFLHLIIVIELFPSEMFL